MRIFVLIENTAVSPAYSVCHGLSLFIKTAEHRILFDTGANGSYIKNASLLGVDLASADTAIISHGHYDHGGGIRDFFSVNDKAPVYIHEKAFGGYYSAPVKGGVPEKYIGIDPELEGHPRFVGLDEDYRISESLFLFTGVSQKKLPVRSNNLLFKASTGGTFVKDDFVHEMNLIIEENGVHTLVCGCAHNGIINIIEHCTEIIGKTPDHVIGGFHLRHETPGSPFLDDMADALRSSGVGSFHTCHCTGEPQFEYLRDRVENLSYIRTGSVFDL